MIFWVIGLLLILIGLCAFFYWGYVWLENGTLVLVHDISEMAFHLRNIYRQSRGNACFKLWREGFDSRIEIHRLAKMVESKPGVLFDIAIPADWISGREDDIRAFLDHHGVMTKNADAADGKMIIAFGANPEISPEFFRLFLSEFFKEKCLLYLKKTKGWVCDRDIYADGYNVNPFMPGQKKGFPRSAPYSYGLQLVSKNSKMSCSVEMADFFQCYSYVIASLFKRNPTPPERIVEKIDVPESQERGEKEERWDVNKITRTRSLKCLCWKEFDERYMRLPFGVLHENIYESKMTFFADFPVRNADGLLVPPSEDIRRARLSLRRLEHSQEELEAEIDKLRNDEVYFL